MKKNYIKTFRICVMVASFLIFATTASAENIINVPADFPTIQEAIDAASLLSGDSTIQVAAGTYQEYLHITTDNLTIIGAGIDQSIIDLDGLIPYWHYAGCSRSFGSRAGVLISGYLSPGPPSALDVVEGVTFKGFTVKNAGLNPPITATGTHNGPDNVAVLTDTNASWPVNGLVDQWVHNVSDKLIKIDISGNNPIRSYGLIIANTATTVTADLAGGLDNDWDVGDTYEILPYEEYVDVAEDLQDDVPGIAIGNGKDISILDCKVINSGSSGITAGYARCVTAQHRYSEGLTIDNCIVSDGPNRGISIGNYVGEVTITNNVCSNNGSPHPTDPSRQYQGTGINVAGIKNGGQASGVISGNICSDNGFIGINLNKYTDGITVENNIVTGHNFDQDGAGIFFYGDKSNPVNCKNHTIRNNTVTGNIRGIIAYYAQECTIEGNTITTDSGDFDPGQEAIKIDGGNNILVKDNDISCDGVGIGVSNTWNDVESYDNTFTGNTINRAKFAGIRIRAGAYDNEFMYNLIKDTRVLTRWGTETQGDGVIIDDSAGTGNVFHYNNINNNEDDGMENQTGTMVDAENNWWGDCSGPDGAGDSVSGLVDYDPWLGEPLCDLKSAIDDLLPSDFKKSKAADGQRAGLLDMVDSVSDRLNDGSYQNARRMLTRQITRAIDKWIDNDEAENDLKAKIALVISEIIDVLEGP